MHFSYSGLGIVMGILATVSSVCLGQDQTGRLAGAWVLTGQNYASGKAVDSTADFNLIDGTRVTIMGESSGTIVTDEPIRYGDARVQFSCRGVIRSRFTLSRVAGLIVMHEVSGIETAGPACRQNAGAVTKQDDETRVIEITGDTLRTINASTDAAGKNRDLVIYTYKRSRP